MIKVKMHMKKNIECVSREDIVLDKLNHFWYSTFSKENKNNNNQRQYIHMIDKYYLIH
jgi:hypothetical protein